MKLSRTARGGDNELFGIEDLILEYAGLPKKFDLKFMPRYRFWEYAIIFALAKEEGYVGILDVNSAPETDFSFRILAEKRNLFLEEVTVEEFFSLGILENKQDIVSCLGEMEFVKNDVRFLYKLAKHVRIGGCLALFTDIENPRSYKHRILTPELLFHYSSLLEPKGFEFYNQQTFDAVDYIEEDNKPRLESLILQRVGK